MANQKKVPVKQKSCPWQFTKSNDLLLLKVEVARDQPKYAIVARGNFQKSARETLMLPVANREIKKFHGQQKVSRGKKNTV